jgi:hypothetical protein
MFDLDKTATVSTVKLGLAIVVGYQIGATLERTNHFAVDLDLWRSLEWPRLGRK